MENEANEGAKSKLEKRLWSDMKKFLLKKIKSKKIQSKEIQNRYQIMYQINEENSSIPNKIDNEDKPNFKEVLVSCLKERLDCLRKRANVVGVDMFTSTTAEEK